MKRPWLDVSVSYPMRARAGFSVGGKILSMNLKTDSSNVAIYSVCDKLAGGKGGIGRVCDDAKATDAPYGALCK